MIVDRIDSENPGQGDRRPEGDDGEAQNRVESPGAGAPEGRTLCNVDGHNLYRAQKRQTQITEIITLRATTCRIGTRCDSDRVT